MTQFDLPDAIDDSHRLTIRDIGNQYKYIEFIIGPRIENNKTILDKHFCWRLKREDISELINNLTNRTKL